MRRTLLLLIASLVLLAGCSQRREEPRPESPQPQGLFPYYRMGSDGFYTGYGLVDAQGTVVLDFVYDALYPVTTYNGQYDPTFSIPADERYFNVGLREIPEDAEDFDATSMRYALASPQGELLSDFIYYEIYRVPGELRFAALSGLEPPVCVSLDGDGRASPLEEGAHLDRLEEYAANLLNWNYYYDKAREKTGPDIPENGLEWISELEDGRYWGCYYDPDTMALWGEDTRMGYINSLVAHLYDEGGAVVGRYSYSDVSRIGEDIYVGVRRTLEDELGDIREECLLIAPDGTPLSDAVYDGFYTWEYNAGAYIVASAGGDAVVLDGATLEEVWRIPIEGLGDENLSLSVNQEGERQYLCVHGSEELPIRIYDLEERGIIELEGFPGGYVYTILAGGTRFIVDSSTTDVPLPEGVALLEDYSNSFLVDADGEVLLAYCQTLYPQRGYLEAGRVRYPKRWSWDNTRSGIYDFDGNELLPMEYTIHSVLDGNAVHVTRGDYSGIVDLAGNWIYRESRYLTLRE